MALMLEEARESRDYWHARARTLPRRKRAARREAIELAERWDRRLDEAARSALLTQPGPALRALIELRRARLIRALRRAATFGVGAMLALAASAGIALDVAWHALRALLG